jgi:glyoxylase-like metal-dependent hydrolase (beta-lactamase superfamily II)
MKPSAGLLKYLWRPAALAYFFAGTRQGVMRSPPVTVLSTFDDGENLDVPGHPQVVHVPGHTAGSCALFLPDRGVLAAGDALCTHNVLTGRRGAPNCSPTCSSKTRNRR